MAQLIWQDWATAYERADALGYMALLFCHETSDNYSWQISRSGDLMAYGYAKTRMIAARRAEIVLEALAAADE